MSKILPFLIAYRKWVAAITVALAISILISAVHPTSRYQVVVAKHTIALGEKLRTEDLELKQIDFLWAQATTQISSVVGTHALRKIDSGEPISGSSVSSRKIFDPQNLRAVVITLPRGTSASELQDGTRVDVYASSENGQARRVVSNALVLSQNTQTGVMDSVATLSLAVSPDQVARLASYDDTVRFTFAALTNS